MKKLYNLYNNEEALERLQQEEFERLTVSFYNYFYISQPQEFRDSMFVKFSKLGVLGRIYIANEGINAQISVPAPNIDEFRQTLYDMDEELNNLRLNIAIQHDKESFLILKIKVRDKIVADGIDDKSFDMINRGKYVNAQEFNQMVDNEDTVLVDMRNHYEYEVGHFDGAIEVPSETFKEQLPMAVDMLQDKKNKKVIMYCTGGIRCEKASTYMKHHGFDEVYHLEGGIINYANQVKDEGLDNKFIGKNFVFDGRLGERISKDVIASCHQCGEICDTHINCANDGCHLLFIQCDNCAKEFDSCCSVECQEIIKLPEEEQNKLRRNKKVGSKIFNKHTDKLRPKCGDILKKEDK